MSKIDAIFEQFGDKTMDALRGRIEIDSKEWLRAAKGELLTELDNLPKLSVTVDPWDNGTGLEGKYVLMTDIRKLFEEDTNDRP